MERARIFRKLEEHAARGEAVRRLRHPHGHTLDALRCVTVKTASKSIHAFAVSVFLQFSQPVLCRHSPLAHCAAVACSEKKCEMSSAEAATLHASTICTEAVHTAAGLKEMRSFSPVSLLTVCGHRVAEMHRQAVRSRLIDDSIEPPLHSIAAMVLAV